MSTVAPSVVLNPAESTVLVHNQRPARLEDPANVWAETQELNRRAIARDVVVIGSVCSDEHCTLKSFEDALTQKSKDLITNGRKKNGNSLPWHGQGVGISKAFELDLRRIAAMRSIEIGDKIVINIPDYGAIAVATCIEKHRYDAKDPIMDASKWHTKPGFAHRIRVTWDVAPKPQGSFYQALFTIPNSFMHRETTTAQGRAEGHQLLALCHQMAAVTR